MALPTTRDETAVAAAQVKSAMLNNIQDCIVGGKHGSITRVIPISCGQAQYTATPPSVATDFYINANGDYAGRTGKVVVGIPCLIGERVTAIRVTAKDVDGTHKFYGRLFVRDPAARTAKSDLTASAGSGASQWLALANVVAHTLVATERLEVDITIDAGAGADYVLYNIEVTYEST